jgi:SpoVK/Ycf46/Vps4 family AAA+-type ATPase
MERSCDRLPPKSRNNKNKGEYMVKTKQLFRWHKDKPKRNIAIILDKEERFVVRNCIVYLESILEHDTILDKKYLEMLSWVLGDKFKKIEKYIFNTLTAKEKEKYQSDFQNINKKCQSIDLISHILYKSSKKRITNFVSYTREILLNRYKFINYSGCSDTEKKILNLEKMLNLSEQEIKFCTFVYITTAWQNAEEYFISHIKCHTVSGRRYLRKILRLRNEEINAVLSETLIKNGFCEIGKAGFSSTEDFAKYFLTSSNEAPETKYFNKISCKDIPLDNPLIDSKKTEHILKVLRAKRNSSTHILLYGAPGSGKANYAYWLAKKLRVPAYEISKKDNKATKRHAAIMACLNITNNKESVIIIDEADSLLNAQSPWLTENKTNDKGWLKQFLEEPDNRIIWIVNSINEIDNSILKLFAFSLHFKKINQRQRFNLWQSALSHNMVEKWFKDHDLKELSNSYPVDAADIDYSIKEALNISSTSQKDFKEALIINLDSRMEIIENKRKDKDKAEYKGKVINNNIEDNYSIDGLNVEGNLTFITEQLKAYDRFLRESDKNSLRNFNLLFYGPPGTGKSEFARYIAEHLERGIMCKRASDIISPYVGETEKNINRAFAEAEADEAILIIDEADSFLFKRSQAVRSFEINRTNEFLTQMERFRGILVCTTNMLEGLDSASIRRFNHKIKFDYLKPEDNIIFYKRLLSPLISSPLNEVVEKELQAIRQLAPGDFRIVRDRFSFYPQDEINHQVLLEALGQECHIKQFQKNGGRRIGF